MHHFLVLLACILSATLAQPSLDPCAFPPNADYPTVWVTNRDALLECFNSVPFDETNRTQLLKVLNYTWQAYSFHDYVSEPIPPYNIQVRAPVAVVASFSLRSPLIWRRHFLIATHRFSLLSGTVLSHIQFALSDL